MHQLRIAQHGRGRLSHEIVPTPVMAWQKVGCVRRAGGALQVSARSGASGLDFLHELRGQTPGRKIEHRPNLSPLSGDIGGRSNVGLATEDPCNEKATLPMIPRLAAHPPPECHDQCLCSVRRPPETGDIRSCAQRCSRSAATSATIRRSSCAARVPPTSTDSRLMSCVGQVKIDVDQFRPTLAEQMQRAALANSGEHWPKPPKCRLSVGTLRPMWVNVGPNVGANLTQEALGRHNHVQSGTGIELCLAFAPLRQRPSTCTARTTTRPAPDPRPQDHDQPKPGAAAATRA